MRSIRRTVFASLAVAALLVGCGDDDSGHSAALLTIGDFNVEDNSSEASNLMFALQEAGFSLDTTSATDSSSMAALLAGKDLLFIPEADPSFDAATQGLVTAWVDAGGTIVMVGGYTQVDWLNTALGWHLRVAESFNDTLPMPKTEAAAGTPFADGPASILGNNGGSTLDIDSMPVGAIAVYLGIDPDTNASVAILPYGDGQLVYFGWDWYNGKPHGEQDGGWRKLLKETSGF